MIKPVKQKTVVFQVMEQLKELIETGVLKPKQKVPNEYELAKMFNVGRSSIREALKIFQYLGIVEIKYPTGTFIGESSNISSEALVWAMLLGQKDFSELIELRMVLEQQGLWHVLVHQKENRQLMDSLIALLRQEIENMKKAIENGSIKDRLIADYQFHGHIIHVSKNKIFDNLYTTMQKFMVEEIQKAQSDIENLFAIPKNHESLLTAILNGDYLLTCEAFRHHIRNMDRILNSKIRKDK